MKKFKPVVRRDTELAEPKLNKDKAPAKKNDGSKLPPDTYKPILEEQAVVLETESATAEYELRFNVTRLGEFGLPHVDIRTYVDSPNYTDMTKKGVNFPIEQLDEVLDTLTSIRESLRAKKLI